MKKIWRKDRSNNASRSGDDFAPMGAAATTHNHHSTSSIASTQSISSSTYHHSQQQHTTAPSAQSLNYHHRASMQTITTIDEHPDSHHDPHQDADTSSSILPMSMMDTASSLTRIDTQSSNGYQRRMLTSKTSKSTLNPNNNRPTARNMAALVKPEWDNKVTKNGWLNRANSEFADESLKLVRAELKGSHLYIYKPPSDLFNVRCFRFASPLELNVATASSAPGTATAAPGLAHNSTSTSNNSTTSDDNSSLLDQLSTSPTLTSNMSSLRKPSLINSTLNDSTEELDNLQLNSDDTRSIRSKRSASYLQQPLQIQSEDDAMTQSSLSLSPSRTSTTQVSSNVLLPSIKLTYYSAKYPHPNLNIDHNSQLIVSGDLESICHAILFNTYSGANGDNDKITRHLLSLLPLFGDITSSLMYFKKYSDIFISEPRNPAEYHKENHDEELVIPKKTEFIMTQRLKLIVHYIKDNFPGMLLEDSIFRSLWDLLVSLNVHEDCEQLQKDVHSKQKQLYSLLNQVDEPPQGNVIESELLPANFLKLDLQEFAREINNINLKFNKVWNPQMDCSLLFETIHDNYSYYRKNPLIFDSTKNLHYLGRLLVSQLFLDPLQSRKSSKRAKIITKWIELGSYFDKIGDMVSWLAIATIICSVPVLRLKKTWDHVNPEIIKTISTDWAPVVFELDRRSMISDAGHRSSYHVIAPQGIGEFYPKENVIPYFGDLYVKKPDNLTIKQCERKTQRVIVSLNRWQEYVINVENGPGVESLPLEETISETGAVLYSLFNYHISCPPLTLETVMDYSLAVEPSSNGIFNKYHNNSRSPLFLGSYPSVIFPHTLPKYKVYDQKLLIGAIGNELTTDNVYDNTKSNILNSTTANADSNLTKKQTNTSTPLLLSSLALHLSLQRPGRNQFLKNVRDIFNIDSSDLHVSDSIIFKAMLTPETTSNTLESEAPEKVDSPVTEPGEVSFDNSVIDQESNGDTSVVNSATASTITTSNNIKPRSRPSSVLFNESANVKRYSNYSSNLEDFQKASGNSNRNSKFKAEEKVCEMFAKLATLDRLIDLLILTANIFASEINPQDIQNYDQNSKDVSFKMDNGVYTVTFFATYRSFCSTSTLLKALLKRFLGAKSALVSIYKRRQVVTNDNSQIGSVSDEYPTWSETISETHPDYNKVIWKYVAQIQIGILEALITLVKDHYDHFVDDLQIRKDFVDILRAVDDEVIVEWTKVLSRLEAASQNEDSVKTQVAELHDYYDQILSLYKKLRKVYIKKSYKPFENDTKSPVFTSSLTSIPKENDLPPSDDIESIELFINEFDELVAILFNRISINDLLQVFELIEIQAGTTTTGLFNYLMQKLNVPDDQLVISDVFSWFASLYTDKEGEFNDTNGAKEYMVNKFPPTVKSIVQLYYKLKTYLVAQITDPNIQQEQRIDRMKCILKILVLSRYKMQNVDLFESNCDANEVSPHVPSLIETSIINSILSVESRLFSESWKLASNSFKPHDEQLSEFPDLESLVPSQEYVIDISKLKNHNNLTPCIGWLSERLIEIACYIPNMSVLNTKLINFDKRRYVYNCVSNILDLKEATEGEAITNIENFKFLFKLKDDELADIEDIKKVALLENATADVPTLLFQELIDEERKILRKEHAKHAFLKKQEEERKSAAAREPLQYQLKNNGGLGHTPTLSSNVIPTSISTTRLSKRSSLVESPGKSRFKFNLFNRNGRNFPFGAQATPDRIVRNIDLPDPEIYPPEKQRPSLVLNLKDLSIFPIYRVPGLLKIDGPNDTEYFFQGLSDLDKEDWIYKMNYAKRHWYFSKTLNKNVSPNTVFGVPIEYICMRESSLIPNIIDKLITEIEVRGLEEVGIYRKSASLSVLHLLRSEIDKYGDFNMENHLIFDINNATGCIKSFLREIPDSLVPDELIPEFGEVRNETNDFKDRLVIYKKTLPRLPYHSFHLLKRIIRHLKVVDEFSQFNKMTASNLSTIIGATFTEAANPELTKKYFGLMNFVCEDMIKHYDEIFEN